MIDLRAWLELIRLPNVFTAIADIMAGYFIASGGELDLRDLGFLIFSSSFLYAGGIVLNDFFDYRIDREERPGRPIPSGRIRRDMAGVLGWGLLLFGMILALAVGQLSFMVSLGTTLLVLSYNVLTKHITILGPVNMGLCRYMNFTLGMSPWIIGWDVKLFIPLIVMVYIMLLTFISLNEAGNLKARGVVRVMLLGIIPLDAAVAMFGAGIGYGVAVLMLMLPSYLSSKTIYMT